MTKTPPALSPTPITNAPGVHKTETTAIRSFSQGLALPFRSAVFLLAHPRLWVYVIIPLVINAILFTLIISFGWNLFHDFISTSTSERTGWLWNFFSGAIQILFWLLSLLIIYFIFTPMALIISGPFNDFLSERVEGIQGIQIAEEGSWKHLPMEILFILKNEVIRMIVTFGVLAALFMLNLLPVIGNTLYVVLGFYWTSRCAAIEFTSYSADRRKIPFLEKWHLIRAKKPLTLGFGMMTVVLLLIPFVNVFTVSISAVGGTFLFAAIDSKK